MKKLFALFCLAGTLACAGCSGSDDAAAIPAPDPTPQPRSAATVPVADALGHLDRHLSHSTRATEATYDVSEVLTVRRSDFGPATRAAENAPAADPDAPLAYIVNFEHGGYAILGADVRLSPVVAVCGERSMSPASLVATKRAVDSGETVETVDYLNALAANYLLTAPDDPDNQLRLANPPTGEWTVKEHREPFLVTKWSQHGPYNQYCKNAKGKVCPAGCVPLAVAQILVYNHWKYGKGFNIFPSDLPYIDPYRPNWTLLDRAASVQRWTSMTEEELNEVCRFIKVAGLSVNVFYDPDGSPAASENVEWLFQNLSAYRNVEMLGFKNGTYVGTELDMWTTIQETVFKNALPIYMSGGYIDARNQYVGYAWVVDGWKLESYSNPSSPAVNVAMYVYCNYGQGDAEDFFCTSSAFAMGYNEYQGIVSYYLKDDSRKPIL